jgi:uncharacterized heparinase superfamily protein
MSFRPLVARLQNLRSRTAPDAPAASIRDPWPGDPSRGARLVRAELEFGGATLPLPPGIFAGNNAAPAMRAHLTGFTWLRDLRALGTDAARARARALVEDFFAAGLPAPDTAAARIGAWLGHYDFFAASADDDFRQRLLARIVTDARTLAAALPPENLDQRALTALKGVLAASVALPEHANHFARALKFLTPELSRQFAADGCHVERSPAAQLAALADLTEIRALIQLAGAEPPEALLASIDRAAAALRALRHGDGSLALFNGTGDNLPSLTDLVLAQAGRARGAVANLSASGFARMTAGKFVAIFDTGAPPPPGLDRTAHAGTLSFELSHGKERIIVNCGAAPAAATGWADALRSTAAHSTLAITSVSSSDLPGRRAAVDSFRQDSTGTSWVEASHDGYLKLFGATHHRRLGLSAESLQGEDLLEGAANPFTIRFHLHPAVTANIQQDDATVLLRTPSGAGFRLHAERAALTVEESVYFGHAEPRRTDQIVLTGTQDGPQHVSWTITRI